MIPHSLVGYCGRTKVCSSIRERARVRVGVQGQGCGVRKGDRRGQGRCAGVCKCQRSVSSVATNHRQRGVQCCLVRCPKIGGFGHLPQPLAGTARGTCMRACGCRCARRRCGRRGANVHASAQWCTKMQGGCAGRGRPAATAKGRKERSDVCVSSGWCSETTMKQCIVIPCSSSGGLPETC